jgi:hypothetical protein
MTMPVIGIDDRAAAPAIGQVTFTEARRPPVLGFPLDRSRIRQLLVGNEAVAVTFPVTRHRWEGFQDAWTRMVRTTTRRLTTC